MATVHPRGTHSRAEWKAVVDYLPNNLSRESPVEKINIWIEESGGFIKARSSYVCRRDPRQRDPNFKYYKAIIMDMDRPTTDEYHGQTPYGTLMMTASAHQEIPSGRGRVLAHASMPILGHMSVANVVREADVERLGRFVFHPADWAGLSWHLTFLKVIAERSGMVLPSWRQYWPPFDEMERLIRANSLLTQRLLDSNGRAMEGKLTRVYGSES